ncbi:nucleotidyltransferase family protein [Brevibacterium sp. PAMC23299]|nr:nucleotidyltransferase family protein [Brevibacterium sp. PAMC23299]
MKNDYSIDLSNISKELSLLLEILKTGNNNSIRLKHDLFKEIDWDLFLDLSKHHRVFPLIYNKIIKLDDKSIPQHVINTLYLEYKKNTFQMLHLWGEMEQVSTLFTENKIRLLFLKGPIIAAELYGEISHRTSKDLDILIPITDIEKAEKLLKNAGYEREDGPTAFMGDWKWRYHHVAYFHPLKKIQIELHWRQHPFPSNEPSFNELWDRKRISLLTKNPLFYLGKEDLFLYLITHGARHGWFRLRWLSDIDIMLRKGINFKSNNLNMKKYGKYSIVGQAMILSSNLLNTPIDFGFIKLKEVKSSKKLAQSAIYFINGISSLQTIASTKYFHRYLFSLKSNSQKFFSILILFYPTNVDAETVVLPKSLHFLYFLLRPFLSVWRKSRKICANSTSK